ncbi:MAG: hypothetical protein HS108_01805 [Planctomycetes bacterium]|jgi:hypothetical protein|nr:hypothetical protein [Planctomycetota bacterium]
MSKILAQVALTVFGVSLLAGLMGVGYLAQTFGPAQFNEPAPRRNQARGNWADSNEPRNPIPKDEPAWKDWDEAYYSNKERNAVKPGNFEVLAALAETLKSMRAVEKSYGPMAFPFWEEDDSWATKEAWDADESRKDDRARRSGKHRINALRLFNFEVSNVQLITLEQGETELPTRAEFGMSDQEFEHFKEVRKAHPERCVLVLLTMDLKSLESDRIQKAKVGNPLRLVYVKKADGWKLVCNED